MEPDLAGIVKSLTKAQRECVQSMSKASGARLHSLIPVDMPRELIEPVKHRGTALIYRLTPLGLAVRSALVKEKDRGE